MNNIPFIDNGQEEEDIDMGIFNSLDNLNEIGNVRNPELSDGRRVRNQIVNSMFNTGLVL